MSSIFDNELNKDKCQKFTPDNLVAEMLDLAGYTSNLAGKTVLENSFGSGNILSVIVTRYIQDSTTQGLTAEEIAEGLSNDIYGTELDAALFSACIQRLDKLAANYDIYDVKWSLFNDDALTWSSTIFFDYVIGNPPYISYKDIDVDSRKALRENFSSCQTGKFDYCYAFIERGIQLLSARGKLVQLVPANIYKNVFGEKLRNILLPHICVIKEYPGKALFDDALTSSTIFLFDKAASTSTIQYTNVPAQNELVLDKTGLGKKWIFAKPDKHQQKSLRFGNYFHASSVVATLYNKAYLLTEKEIQEQHLETAVIRPAAAPKKMRSNAKEYIIFPYKYSKNGELKRFKTKYFEKKYPNVTAHLKKHTKKLKERTADENISWFEYGRSQALARLNQPKLMMSTVVTNRAEIYILDAKTIPYSGIFITAKEHGYTLEYALEILRSEDFAEYVKTLGVSISGKSKRITCKDINEYKFVKE